MEKAVRDTTDGIRRRRRKEIPDYVPDVAWLYYTISKPDDTLTVNGRASSQLSVTKWNQTLNSIEDVFERFLFGTNQLTPVLFCVPSLER